MIQAVLIIPAHLLHLFAHHGWVCVHYHHQLFACYTGGAGR